MREMFEVSDSSLELNTKIYTYIPCLFKRMLVKDY